jgi:hypothetical protein
MSHKGREVIKGASRRAGGQAASPERAPAENHADTPLVLSLLTLQKSLGNAALERLLEGLTECPAGPAPHETIPASARARLLPAFGADVDSVRIQRDAPLVRAAGARAVTTASTIAFAPGEFAPESERGFRLLAHETAHVIQQATAGRVDPVGESRTAETEAWRAADAAMTVQPASVATGQVVPGAQAAMVVDDQLQRALVQMALVAAPKKTKASATAGQIGDYGKLGPRGPNQIAEHGSPGAVWKAITKDPTTGVSDYTKRNYRKDSALVWSRAEADQKTSQISRSDLDAIRSVKDRTSKGLPVDVVEEGITGPVARMKEARNLTPGAKTTDAQIQEQALKQFQKKFDLQRPAETGAKVKAFSERLQAQGNATAPTPFATVPESADFPEVPTHKQASPGAGAEGVTKPVEGVSGKAGVKPVTAKSATGSVGVKAAPDPAARSASAPRPGARPLRLNPSNALGLALGLSPMVDPEATEAIGEAVIYAYHADIAAIKSLGYEFNDPTPGFIDGILKSHVEPSENYVDLMARHGWDYGGMANGEPVWRRHEPTQPVRRVRFK